MLALLELAAVNFTVPATFGGSARTPVTTAMWPPIWMALAVSVTGISTASALQAVSVASTTMTGVPETATPE